MKLKYILFILVVAFAYGCRKASFLDARPDNALVIPTTIEDLQSILDNDWYINGGTNEGIIPSIGEAATDDYFIGEAIYSILGQQSKKIYTWDTNLYTGEEIFDWASPYRAIFYCNVVLDGLENLPVDQRLTKEYQNVLGSALFIRAHLFYQLAQVFAPVYDASTAATEWGIPLRLKSDVNEPIVRATVEETYTRIREDLERSIALLPEKPRYATRPSQWASYALLSRMYVSMQKYEQSLRYADSCLMIDDELLDYNELDTAPLFPMTLFNKEVIFHSLLLGNNAPNNFVLGFGISQIDSVLLKAYTDHDLRKDAFFKSFGGNTYFGGSYSGSSYLFGGLATDEVWLIRAENYARLGQTQAALDNLNALLQYRYDQSFTPVTAADPASALAIILSERRKELVMRGLRWTDLRRLNKEGAGITIQRNINQQTFILPPNDLRYTYPIPPTVITYHPDMPQNKR